MRSDSSARPCTSWSSCTENSTSRNPPGAELELAVGLGRGDVLLDPAAHRLHVVDEVLARREACHTIGCTASQYICPTSLSPATGRALSSAWNSHVLAQRS